MERLQKVIAASGITSRRKAEQYITQGRVRVNGEVVTQLGTQVKKGDVIEVDGEVIARENKVYYLMNKPKKTLCASSDDRGRQTVIDLMECEERVFTVGRLDYDTSGALLQSDHSSSLPSSENIQSDDQRDPDRKRHEGAEGRDRAG